MSTVKTILYIHKTLKNQQHPVMIYLYEDKPYRLSLEYSCTPKEWDEAQARFRKNVENYKDWTYAVLAGKYCGFSDRDD